jgi:prepilin-type N-terminal cleavage/methylation domain-containing protein/prepilin-type processing-associated H-X9-DG protein
MWTRRKNGFTLIELLVVIAIILVLAAILFPVFVRAQQVAVRNTCASHMREIALALYQYAGDNAGRVPPSFSIAMMNRVATSPAMGSLIRYMRTARLAQCSATTAGMADQGYFPMILNHARAAEAHFRLTYGLNARFMNGGAMMEQVQGGIRVPNWTYHYFTQTLESPPIPTRTILLIESQLRADWKGEAGQSLGQGAPPVGCGGDSVFGDWNDYFWAIRWLDYPYVPFGHTGGCNIVMADSHVKFVKAPKPNPNYPPDYSYLEQPQIGLRWW